MEFSVELSLSFTEGKRSPVSAREVLKGPTQNRRGRGRKGAFETQGLANSQRPGSFEMGTFQA